MCGEAQAATALPRVRDWPLSWARPADARPAGRACARACRGAGLLGRRCRDPRATGRQLGWRARHLGRARRRSRHRLRVDSAGRHEWWTGRRDHRVGQHRLHAQRRHRQGRLVAGRLLQRQGRRELRQCGAGRGRGHRAAQHVDAGARRAGRGCRARERDVHPVPESQNRPHRRQGVHLRPRAWRVQGGHAHPVHEHRFEPADGHRARADFRVWRWPRAAAGTKCLRVRSGPRPSPSARTPPWPSTPAAK